MLFAVFKSQLNQITYMTFRPNQHTSENIMKHKVVVKMSKTVKKIVSLKCDFFWQKLKFSICLRVFQYNST